MTLAAGMSSDFAAALNHACNVWSRINVPESARAGTKIPATGCQVFASPRSDGMTSDKNLQELFHETLKDIYFAEKKILSALPKMAKAAESKELNGRDSWLRYRSLCWYREISTIYFQPTNSSPFFDRLICEVAAFPTMFR
jgi:hypothetical protein